MKIIPCHTRTSEKEWRTLAMGDEPDFRGSKILCLAGFELYVEYKPPIEIKKKEEGSKFRIKVPMF